MVDPVAEMIADSGAVDAVVVTAGTPKVADAAGSEVAVVAVAELGETGSTPAPTLDNPEGLAGGFEDAVDIGEFEAAADAEVTAPAASNAAAVDKFVTGSNNVLTEPSPPVASEVAVEHACRIRRLGRGNGRSKSRRDGQRCRNWRTGRCTGGRHCGSRPCGRRDRRR